MINKLEVYTPTLSVPIIDFDDSDPVETDYIYVMNIEGLGPVKASINVMDSGSRDGVIPVGSNVPSRNIVLTLRPNPDWDNWTPETLRQVIYAYFTPKNSVNLVFDSDEIGEATIFGLIESCEPNLFSKDPEYVVSIICPDPYFTVGDQITKTLTVGAPDTWVTNKQLITLKGNIETGFNLKIPGFNADVIIQMGNSIVASNPPMSTFRLSYPNPSNKDIEINTVRGKRFVRAIDPITGVYSNIMDAIVENSVWPMLQPGDNTICVTFASDPGAGVTCDLTYRERYGGI